MENKREQPSGLHAKRRAGPGHAAGTQAGGQVPGSVLPAFRFLRSNKLCGGRDGELSRDSSGAENQEHLTVQPVFWPEEKKELSKCGQASPRHRGDRKTTQEAPSLSPASAARRRACEPDGHALARVSSPLEASAA
uniref:Uncharacterized protein n=1 Tax=Pipistrellus kuhlii TaxID=59472 RepID=A0A7J7RM86_PIPKU|nr:hypothetical protein mPipKuh1_010405 [Pipistrellus kuhlii]